MTKVSISMGISKATEAELVERSATMVNGLTAQSADLPTPPVLAATMAALATTILNNRKTINSLYAQVRDLEQQNRDGLEQLKASYKVNAAYVEQVINATQKNNLAAALGLKLREKRTAVNSIGVPQSVVLHEIPYTHQKLSLVFKAVKGAKSYGAVWSIGAMPPEQWPEQAMKIFTSSKNIVIEGLESGQTIWLRVKAYGMRNSESDWSDVVTRIVP